MDSTKEIKTEQRELKFRVWNGSEMVYDVMVGKFGVFYVNPSNNGLDEKDSASLTPFTTKYHDGTPVMQFTGLIDKNRKEIYESDIVKVTGPWDDDDGSNIKTIVIEFADEGGYAIEWSNGFCGGDADITLIGWAMNEGYTFEVIGNIYQNPELLK